MNKEQLTSRLRGAGGIWRDNDAYYAILAWLGVLRYKPENAADVLKDLTAAHAQLEPETIMNALIEDWWLEMDHPPEETAYLPEEYKDWLKFFIDYMKSLNDELPFSHDREKEIVVDFQERLAAQFDYFADLEIRIPE